jgi:hypothetical protein
VFLNSASFQRIVLYKTLHKLRSSSNPHIERLLQVDRLTGRKDVSLAELDRLGDEFPEVRAEHIRQTNKLLLPRLRNDVKALRLDTAQRLTRLAEVMAEVDRLAAMEQPASTPSSGRSTASQAGSSLQGDDPLITRF